MDLQINSIYLSSEALDVESGQREIEDLGPDGLVAAAPQVNILGFGWVRPGDEVETPWASDRELTAFMGDVLHPAFDTSLETLQALELSYPQVADRYRGYIRQSALRWLDNLAILASGQDRSFESRLAERIGVESGGTLLLAPENFSANLTLSTIYGDIIGAADAAFPTVAAAAGAYPLSRCRLSIRVERS